MPRADFDEFVKRQHTVSAADKMAWGRQQRDEWLGYLDELYKQIEIFLKGYLTAGQARCEYSPIERSEESIGIYTAKQMVLIIGPQQIKFTPIGTLFIGTKGRVDVLGPAGEARLLLVNKKATSARSLFKVTARVGTTAPSQVSQPAEPIEWAWKIASNPPDLTFIDFTQEAFFDMILAVVNA
ncbi:MAG: hypothetical protein ACLPWS_11620 [Rhodomicrobium sp.]